jgi:alkylhydroperoxidase/carboxymuconolactone decarboxylase family protein YurZ
MVKLAMAIGTGMEGAVHSHTRRAMEAGASPAEIRHPVLLSFTTLGFPSTVASLTWVEDVPGRAASAKRAREKDRLPSTFAMSDIHPSQF